MQSHRTSDSTLDYYRCSGDRSEPIMSTTSEDDDLDRPMTLLTDRLSDHWQRRRKSPSRDSSTRSTSPAPSSNLVETPQYRRQNLDYKNGTKLRDPDRPLAAIVQALIESLDMGQPALVPTEDNRRHFKAMRAHQNGYFRPLETVIRYVFDDMIFPRGPKVDAH